MTRNNMAAHPRWRTFQYGGHFKMADFQQRNQYGGNFNIANISIKRKISQYGNKNSDTPLLETDNINTAQHLRVYSNRDLLPQIWTRSFKQRSQRHNSQQIQLSSLWVLGRKFHIDGNYDNGFIHHIMKAFSDNPLSPLIGIFQVSNEDIWSKIAPNCIETCIQ